MQRRTISTIHFDAMPVQLRLDLAEVLSNLKKLNRLKSFTNSFCLFSEHLENCGTNNLLDWP